MPSSLHIEINAGAEAVTRIATAADLPRPHLAVVGAVHGNERCGLFAIQRLHAELESGALELQAGTLFLVHGNPDATRERHRHTLSGVDLNRVFDFRFERELEPALWKHEHRRALALRPLLESVDALLDLHSASAPTPAFAIASRVAASAPFARALGLEYVTFGWDGPGLLGDLVLIGQLTRRERPGVSVECGQHDDEAAVEVAYRCALHALAHFGMLAASWPATTTPPEQLTLKAAIKRPSESFRFERPLRGMQRLTPGEVIGHSDHLWLSVRSPCYAIMPNDCVAVGEDMLYIAEKI